MTDQDTERRHELKVRLHRLACATREHASDCSCGFCVAQYMTEQQLAEIEKDEREFVERRTTNAGQGGG